MATDGFATASTADLQQVLQHPAIWRARQLAEAQRCRSDKGIATGFADLDSLLPDGGWPLGALSEVLVDASGLGELSLLLPALRQLCRQGRGVALLAPPWLPQARVWEVAGIPLSQLLLVESSGTDLLWSAEQCLRSGECGAVLLWGAAAGRALDQRALQRLQLAAVAGNALCFLFRPCSAAANPSPAPLRLKLAAQDGLLQIHCLKRRGAPLALPLSLPIFPAYWQGHTAVGESMHTGTLATFNADNKHAGTASAAVMPAAPVGAVSTAATPKSPEATVRPATRQPLQLQLCAL